MARNRLRRARSHAGELDRWHQGLHSALRPKSRRRRRLRTVVGLFLALVVSAGALCAGLIYTYAQSRMRQIARFPCAGCVSEGGGAPTTVLFVGSDTRADIPRSEAIHFCERADCSDQTGPAHSDAITLLRFYPAERRATVLSIPRDLNVPIAGLGRRDRINVAFAAGAGRVVDTIRADFGISVDHVIVADFVGFRTIVGAIGGLNVYFPTPARDVLSGLVVPRAGCVHLDGNGALAYVRSRHYQFLSDGRWHNDPLSDLSRLQRQQDFMRRLMRTVRTIRNPFVLKRLVDTSVHWVRADDRLSLGDVFHIGRWLQGIGPDAIAASTLPTDPIRVGSADELRLREPQASEMIGRFLQTSHPSHETVSHGIAPAALSPSPGATC